MSSNPQPPTQQEIEEAVRWLSNYPTYSALLVNPDKKTNAAIRTILAALELYQKDSERLDWVDANALNTNQYGRAAIDKAKEASNG